MGNKLYCHQTSNIRCTKSHNWNVSRLILQLSLRNLLKLDLSWEWRCSWSSADRRCSNYICVINSLITYSGAAYIRDLTVLVSFRIALLYSTIIYPQFSMLTHWHWGNHMSPLIQVMTCCLTSPSHYLNQCWLTIAPVQVKQPWRVVGKLLIWICSAKTKQSKQACIC